MDPQPDDLLTGLDLEPDPTDPMESTSGEQPAADPGLVRRQISRWVSDARVPQWLVAEWDGWRRDRKYVAEELFKTSDANAMSVNLALRLMMVKLSKILPTDTDMSARMERSVESVVWVRRDAIRAAAAANPAAAQMNPMALIAAADQAEQSYRQELEYRERFMVTCEALAKKLGDEGAVTARLEELATGGMTCGPMILKVGWQKDGLRTAAGVRRHADAEDKIALLALRSAEFAAGRFGPGDVQYDELMHLTRYAMAVAQAVVLGQAHDDRLSFDQWEQIADHRDDGPVPMTWMPDQDHWQGVDIGVVQPERFRWDWRHSWNQIDKSPWFMEQVPMDVDDLASQFKLNPEEKDQLGNPSQNYTGSYRDPLIFGTAGGGGNAADPDLVVDEAAIQRGKVILWDRWDVKTGRHTMFVEGMERYLVDEVPEVVPPWGHPYVLDAFVLPDQAKVPLGVVRFLRKIQDAINQRLTDSQESLWASMKRYLVKKGAFRDGELEKLQGARPHDTIEVDDPAEIKSTFMEIASDDWNPEKYDLNGLFRLLELVMGMSLSELGVVNNAKFATEVATSNASSGQQAGREGDILARIAAKVYQAILAYAGAAMSERTVRDLCGRAAYWPMAPSRDAMLRLVRVKVAGAGQSDAARESNAKTLQTTIQTLGAIINLKQQGMMAQINVNIDPLTAAALRIADVDAGGREILTAMPQTGMVSGPPVPGMQPSGPGAQPMPPGQPGPGMPPQANQSPAPPVGVTSR